MDTSVPYSLSDIQLPDSPGDAMKPNKSPVKSEGSNSLAKVEEIASSNSELISDNEVQSNGVNSSKKIRKENLSGKSSDNETLVKDKSSKVKTVSQKSNKNSKSNKIENKSDHVKHKNIENISFKSKSKSPKNLPKNIKASGSKSKSSNKKKAVTTSHYSESDEESKTSDSNSSEGSSNTENVRKHEIKRVHSPLHKRRRKHRSTSSTSSQSSKSKASNLEKLSDGEIETSSKVKNCSDKLVSKYETADVAVDKCLSINKIPTDIAISDSSDPPRKKLKINRNNVVIPTSEETVKLSSVVSDKNSSEECVKISSKKSNTDDENMLNEKQRNELSPNQESSESVEREMGEIIENFPEIKYEPRKLKFPGRKLSRVSSEEQAEESKSKKSKWGKFAASQRTSQTINISTDSLKNWFPDFKLVNEPVPISEIISEDSPTIKEDAKTFPLHLDDRTTAKEANKMDLASQKEQSSFSETTETSGPISKIVFIQNLVRPFTLLQLKELLKQTGNIIEEKFWIDKIKSKCFATYATEEEAIKTKNALNGTRWPSSNPKILIAEFSKEEKLELHRSGGDIPKPVHETISQPQNTYETKTSQADHKKREREPDKRKDRERYRMQAPVREWDKDKVLQESPNRNVKEDEFRTEKKEKKDIKKRANEDTPAKLLDDLFQKTKAVPCIYWLPLTENQVLEHEEEKRQRRIEREKRIKQREQEEAEHRNKRSRSDYKSREAESKRSSRSHSPSRRH